jgi:ubiquinone/menaquinone biosynthesis C-methylase UbiE
MASSTSPEPPGAVEGSVSHPSICDYEGSAYRTDFWTQDRSYEDAAERIALEALLPPAGRRLIEIGAGFGRLADLYAGYEQVILFDYSRSLLQEARAQWGEHGPLGRPRYIYVAADFNRFPFVAGLFNTVTMVRVIHHAPDVPRVLNGISEIIAPDGTFVLEFANKRNLKAIGRWLLKRQLWSPFDLAPYEFAELNYDYHPHWVQTQLRQTGFVIQRQRSVSHFRLGVLKRHVRTQWLAKLDGLVQPTGRWWQLAPSVFVASRATKTGPAAEEPAFFRCPVCRGAKLVEQPSALICQTCHRAWPIHDGLYDFKEPL